MQAVARHGRGVIPPVQYSTAGRSHCSWTADSTDLVLLWSLSLRSKSDQHPPSSTPPPRLHGLIATWYAGIPLSICTGILYVHFDPAISLLRYMDERGIDVHCMVPLPWLECEPALLADEAKALEVRWWVAWDV